MKRLKKINKLSLQLAEKEAKLKFMKEFFGDGNGIRTNRVDQMISLEGKIAVLKERLKILKGQK